MATPFFVPINNNEGGIGTDVKRWAEGHFQSLNVGGKTAFIEVVPVADQDGRYALNADDVKVGDIVQQGNGSSFRYFTIVDLSNLSNEKGYVAYSGNSAVSFNSKTNVFTVANNGQTSFNLSDTNISDSVLVWINGLLQPASEYSVDSQRLIFNSGDSIIQGDSITVFYFSV